MNKVLSLILVAIIVVSTFSGAGLALAMQAEYYPLENGFDYFYPIEEVDFEADIITDYEVITDVWHEVFSESEISLDYEIIKEVWYIENYIELEASLEYEVVREVRQNESYAELAFLEDEAVREVWPSESFARSEAFLEDEVIREVWPSENFARSEVFLEDEIIKEVWQSESYTGAEAFLEDEAVTEVWQSDSYTGAEVFSEGEAITEVWQSGRFARSEASLEDGIIKDVWLNDRYGELADTHSTGFLNISPTTNWMNIPVAGAVRNVTVMTNLHRYYVIRPTWLNITFGNNGFTLTAQGNPNAFVRTGTVLVSTTSTGGGIVRSFSVSQLASAAHLNISPATNWTNIPVAGAARNVSVATNLQRYYVFRPAWMNVTFVNNGFTLTAQQNPNAFVRTGTVTVSSTSAGGGIVRSFSVSQLAAPAHLNISPTTNWTNIPVAGAARTINVTTNLQRYYVFTPSWMNLTFGANGFTLTAQQNPHASVRTGTITVSSTSAGGGIVRSFSVSQLAAAAHLTISPSTNWTNIPVIGAVRNVTVTTNLQRYYVFRPTWMNLTFGNNGFTLTAQQNPNAYMRTGTVTVSTTSAGGGIVRSFSVSQIPASPQLTISPTTNWIGMAPGGGATRTINVTTNLPNYTVYRPAWLTLAWVSGGFRLTAQANPNAAARTGMVTVTGGGITRSFTVSQLAAAANLTISPTTNWNSIAPGGGATRTINVTTNLPNYTVYRPTWLTFAWVSGGFSLTAQANPNTTARTGTVTVTGGGITRSFNVSQLGVPANLTISPTTNWNNIASGGGATRIINVTTNLPNYTVYSPTWLTLAWVSGGFSLTAQANPNTTARTGTVTVTGGGLTRSFNVSQLGAPAHLTISPATDWTNIPAAGAVRTINVTTNLQRYYVFSPSWMNLTFGANGFTLAAQQNPNVSVRTGAVIVSTTSTGGGIVRIFSVSQLAAAANLTISPTTNWTGIGAEGGAARTVSVTTNLPTFNVNRPDWLNFERITANQFRLTAQANPNASPRTGTVTVTGGGIARSFSVSQLESTSLVTITYSGNGHTSGTVPANQTFNTPGSINLRGRGNLARTGHTFVGWRCPSASFIWHAGFPVSWDNAAQGTWSLEAYWLNLNTGITFEPIRHLTWWWPRSPGINDVPLTNTFFVESNVPLRQVWYASMENARINWNLSNTPINFSRTAGGNHVRVMYVMNGSYLGYLRPLDRTNTNLSSFYILLNARTIGNHARNNNANLSYIVQSVMAHELAHAIGLRDGEQPQNGHPATLGGHSDASLMNANRDRQSVRGPQHFDIESVNMLYR